MKENSIDVSIILPVYNSEKYINRAIESVKISNGYKYEIIVINDASKDNTINYIKKMKNPNIRIFNNNINKGVSYSRNLGIKKARGKYIAFLDADDYVSDNMYNQMLDRIYANNVDICITNYNEIVLGKKYKSKYNYMNIDQNNIVNEFLNDNVSMAVWDKLFRRNFILEKKVFFDETIKVGEDIIFVLECLMKVSKSYCFINEYNYNYCQNDDSVMHEISKDIITLSNITNYVPTYIKESLIKDYKVSWENFQLIQMMKSIHAISRCKKNSLIERKRALESIIDKEKVKRILNSKCNSIFMKIEVFVLHNFGIYIHLLLFPIYDEIKKILRSKL